jgi:DNA-binding winged helix-turn-helix (wHTH) protein
MDREWRVDERPVARFGEYELDLTTSELRRAGRLVPLERQPSKALALLVSRAGRLVERADLRRCIWSEGIHVDFERGLNYCIREIRRVLEDGARMPRFVETIPRHGYRFIATVVVGDVAQPVVTSRMSRLTTAGVAIAVAVSLLAASSQRLAPGHQRNPQHHATAAAIVRAAHDLVFDPATAGGAHHAAAMRIARAVHDAIF